MAWCFSNRASVATVLTTHPCVSQCLGFNLGVLRLEWHPYLGIPCMSFPCISTQWWLSMSLDIIDLSHPWSLVQVIMASWLIAPWNKLWWNFNKNMLHHRTSFGEILTKNMEVLLKMHLEVSPANYYPFISGLSCINPLMLKPEHDATKPLPGQMLISHPWGIVTFTWGQFHEKCSRYQSFIGVWKSSIKASSHISKGPKS